MRTLLPLCALVLTACPGGGDTDPDTDPETQEEINERLFAELVYVEDAPVGDAMTCWSPGEEWVVNTPDELAQFTETRTLNVRDFESEDRVEDATVSLYSNDDVTTEPDQSGDVDVNGDITMTVPVCQPFSYKVVTPPALEATKDTYEAHQVFAAMAVDSDSEINSVSRTTFLLIPSLLGISVDPDKSIIAGGFRDCNDEPIQNAQVVVRDADGNIPESLIVNYFIEDFPARDQESTSEDGLWVAVNVPVGEWTAEAWISDGAGGHTLAGTTTVSTYADSINISNIFWGIDGGIYYPEGCLSTPEAAAE